MRNVQQPNSESRTRPDSRPRVPRQQRNHLVRYAAGIVATVIGAGYVIVSGMPMLAGQWDVGVLLIGFTISVSGLWVVGGAWRSVPRRWRQIGIGSAVGVVLLLTIGSTSQLVIDGAPILSTSETAQAHQLVDQLYRDILVLGQLDVLLAADQADARARYNDYEPAAVQLRKIAGRWSRVDLGDLPDPDIIEVVQHVKTGATFGAQALDLRYVLITEPDSRTETSMRENRGAFMSETLAAGAKLKPLAEKYQVDTAPAGGLE